MLLRPLQYTAVSAYTQQTPLRKLGSQLLFLHVCGGAGSCGNERGQLWALGCVLQRLLRIHGKDGDGSCFLRLLSVSSHSWDLLSWADFSLRPSHPGPCASPGCTGGRGHLCSGGAHGLSAETRPQLAPHPPCLCPAPRFLPSSLAVQSLPVPQELLCLLLPPKPFFLFTLSTG